MSGYFGMPIKYDRPLTPDQIFIGAILVDILQLLRYNTHSVLEFVVSMYCIFILNLGSIVGKKKKEQKFQKSFYLSLPNYDTYISLTI